MHSKPLTVAVTGASGFIGKLICPFLAGAGHKIRAYDFRQTALTRLLNLRIGGPFSEGQFALLPARADLLLGLCQKRLRPALFKLLSSGGKGPDIRSDLTGWVERFQGCDVVIHLAAIPHPNVPGLTTRNYESINYEGAVNIYQAAKQAGVPRFVYASSCQTYFINRFSGWKQFPIREEDADAIQSFFRPHDYGYLKWLFENYLKEHSKRDGISSVALRLEMPGLWGASAANLFIQTSVENLQQAFLLSCISQITHGAHILNIADDWIPESLTNLMEYTRLRWPGVPCQPGKNTSLLCLKRAKDVLEYSPVSKGRYFQAKSIF